MCNIYALTDFNSQIWQTIEFCSRLQRPAAQFWQMESPLIHQPLAVHEDGLSIWTWLDAHHFTSGHGIKFPTSAPQPNDIRLILLSEISIFHMLKWLRYPAYDLPVSKLFNEVWNCPMYKVPGLMWAPWARLKSSSHLLPSTCTLHRPSVLRHVVHTWCHNESVKSFPFIELKK